MLDGIGEHSAKQPDHAVGCALSSCDPRQPVLFCLYVTGSFACGDVKQQALDIGAGHSGYGELANERLDVALDSALVDGHCAGFLWPFESRHYAAGLRLGEVLITQRCNRVCLALCLLVRRRIVAPSNVPQDPLRLGSGCIGSPWGAVPAYNLPSLPIGGSPVEDAIGDGLTALNGNSPRMLSRALPPGVIAPCLPTSAPQPPSGALWLHEIKYDGFRVIARKNGKRVRLYSRPGNDLTWRFPLIVEAIGRLRPQSCIIDGEAVACGDDGIASFDRIRYRHHDAGVFLYAFDLIELDGDDLRREPLNVRKATLASLLARAASGLRFNEHLEGDGPDLFHHACMLGLEGIVSKRKDSQYRSGRSPHWIKSKNPNAPAVKREAEEDWGRWPSARTRRSSR
jgi:bifunctional non-homologous end joining protein LigD